MEEPVPYEYVWRLKPTIDFTDWLIGVSCDKTTTAEGEPCRMVTLCFLCFALTIKKITVGFKCAGCGDSTPPKDVSWEGSNGLPRCAGCAAAWE